jgi:hypothetical protein
MEKKKDTTVHATNVVQFPTQNPHDTLPCDVEPAEVEEKHIEIYSCAVCHDTHFFLLKEEGKMVCAKCGHFTPHKWF